MADKQSILDKISAALEKAITLKIVTYVGKVNPTIQEDTNTKSISVNWSAANPTADFVIATQINLLEGDIINVIPQLEEEQKWIKEYHFQQTQLGREIIKSNFDMLLTAMERVSKLTSP